MTASRLMSIGCVGERTYATSLLDAGGDLSVFQFRVADGPVSVVLLSDDFEHQVGTVVTAPAVKSLLALVLNFHQTREGRIPVRRI